LKPLTIVDRGRNGPLLAALKDITTVTVTAAAAATAARGPGPARGRAVATPGRAPRAQAVTADLDNGMTPSQARRSKTPGGCATWAITTCRGGSRRCVACARAPAPCRTPTALSLPQRDAYTSGAAARGKAASGTHRERACPKCRGPVCRPAIRAATSRSATGTDFWCSKKAFFAARSVC